MIYHITTPSAWAEAKRTGLYQGDMLMTGGSIHCSTLEQLVAVADTLFKGRKDMFVLEVDEEKVGAEIQYVKADNEENYPHILGPLNIDAVLRAVAYPSREDGTYTLPDLTDDRDDKN